MRLSLFPTSWAFLAACNYFSNKLVFVVQTVQLCTAKKLYIYWFLLKFLWEATKSVFCKRIFVKKIILGNSVLQVDVMRYSVTQQKGGWWRDDCEGTERRDTAKTKERERLHRTATPRYGDIWWGARPSAILHFLSKPETRCHLLSQYHKPVRDAVHNYHTHIYRSHLANRYFTLQQ